jgi:hypothetical protein
VSADCRRRGWLAKVVPQAKVVPPAKVAPPALRGSSKD